MVLSPFTRMSNLLWTHCLKQPAFSTHVGRRLKISISPVDILLPPPSLLHKRQKLFLKIKAGLAAWRHILQLRDFSPLARLLRKGNPASACAPGGFFQRWWGENQPERGLPLPGKSCEPEDTSALLMPWWVSEAAKQKERKRHFAKVVVSENKVPSETRKWCFADLLARLLLARGSTATFTLPPNLKPSFLVSCAAAQPRWQLDPERDPGDRTEILFPSSAPAPHTALAFSSPRRQPMQPHVLDRPFIIQ